MEKYSSKQMKTTTLKLMINKAKEELIPLFQLTKQEINQLRSPTIRRWLNANEYPEHSRDIPAHSSIDNFIYFPQKSLRWRGCNVFDYTIIRHEVGHYIHCQINQNMVEEARKVLITGKLSQELYDLGQVVAEYGNFIFKARDYEKFPYDAYKKYLVIFNTHGSLFLPKLSRMTLQEVIGGKLLGE